jgi:uncharacterized protein YjgD (DUF1641 family)
MTANEEKKNEVAEAIKELAKAVNKLADSIALDEPLNFSIARELNKIADGINTVQI